MVIGAFPIAKLGVLAFRQVAKPVSNIIKDRAKHNPLFKKYVCVPPAQFYNWCEVKMKMWALNLGKPVTVPPLNEAMAIELGANLLGEMVVFIFGASALIFEYVRQTSNETKKQEIQRQEKAELVNSLSEMSFRVERQDAQIREMTRILADIGLTDTGVAIEKPKTYEAYTETDNFENNVREGNESANKKIKEPAK